MKFLHSALVVPPCCLGFVGSSCLGFRSTTSLLGGGTTDLRSASSSAGDGPDAITVMVDECEGRPDCTGGREDGFCTSPPRLLRRRMHSSKITRVVGGRLLLSPPPRPHPCAASRRSKRGGIFRVFRARPPPPVAAPIGCDGDVVASNSTSSWSPLRMMFRHLLDGDSNMFRPAVASSVLFSAFVDHSSVLLLPATRAAAEISGRSFSLFGLLGLSAVLPRLLIVIYVAAEVAFLVHFYLVALPRCNRLTVPQPYRDYDYDGGRGLRGDKEDDGSTRKGDRTSRCDRRHLLLSRILNRIERTSLATGADFDEAFRDFVRPWFNVPSIREDEDASFFPRRDDAIDLLSWAFFAKDTSELECWERRQVEDVMLDRILRDEYGLTFESGRTPGVTVRRVNLDSLRPLPRPLAVYALVGLANLVGGTVLRICGFRRYHVTTKRGRGKRSGSRGSSSGRLTYWHRPAKVVEESSPPGVPPPLPLLFFHGIAPGGLTFYVPMILRCLCVDKRRDAFLFENGPISYDPFPTVDPIDEPDTVRGVLEAVDRHFGGPDDDDRREGGPHHPHTRPLAVAGHSFGSCQVTWLLRDPVASSRIRQVALFDPVTVLLSEPDVMVNFLYRKEALSCVNHAKIYLLASSELRTEHYVRRHFAWYNSELWLDDVPDQVDEVLICLSARDEIVNATKVRTEVEVHNNGERMGSADVDGGDGGGSSRVRLIYWPDAGHTSCVTQPERWREIREAMMGEMPPTPTPPLQRTD